MKITPKVKRRMQFLNEIEQEQSGIGMDEERERRVLHADNLEQLALLF